MTEEGREFWTNAFRQQGAKDGYFVRTKASVYKNVVTQLEGEGKRVHGIVLDKDNTTADVFVEGVEPKGE